MNLLVCRIAGMALALGAASAFAQTESETNTPPSKAGGRPSQEEILKRFDTDGDGVLSEAEREAMHQAMQERRGGRGGPPGRRPSREQMIRQFDADGDGQLNEAEKAAMQEAMAKRRAEREARRQKMLERFDTDGNGQLSPEERKVMRETLQAERKSPPPEEKPSE